MVPGRVFDVQLPQMSVAFHPDGRSIAVGGDTGKVYRWSLPAGRPIEPVLQAPFDVCSIAYSGDGTTIDAAFGGYENNGMIRWSAATAETLGVVRSSLGFNGKRNWFTAHSALGGSVVLGSPHAVQRLDARSLSPEGRPTLLQGLLNDVAFDPAGRYFVTCCGDYTKPHGEAQRWDAATGDPIGPPLLFDEAVYRVAFHPGGRWFATGTYGGKLQFWDAATARAIGEPMVHPIEILGLAFAPDGLSLVTGDGSGTIRIWNTVGRSLVTAFPAHTAAIRDLAVSPDGETLASAGDDGILRIWSLPRQPFAELGPAPSTVSESEAAPVARDRGTGRCQRELRSRPPDHRRADASQGERPRTGRLRSDHRS